MTENADRYKSLWWSDCCRGAENLDFSKMALPFDVVINWQDPKLWISVASTLFNPVFWNVVGRLEYRNHFMTRLCGTAHRGCYLLTVIITALGVHRDWRFQEAIQSQDVWRVLDNDVSFYAGWAAICLGVVFVLSSFWKLGITGTFLGDYFGILMESQVTSFPFNVIEHPMYVGTSLNFLGTAIIQKSQAGIFLSGVVWLVYRIASIFEGNYTTMIYANREEGRKMV